jgi:hypothetical protein
MPKRLGLPVSQRTMVKRILGYANAAFLEDSDFTAGMEWYASAQNLAESMAEEFGVTLEIAASVIAATSPRTIWSFNVKHARAILAGEEIPAGALGTNDVRGRNCEMYGFAGLGNGPKVNAFARNIAGDMHEVTIDMWAFAAACGDLEAKYLARKGAYQTVVSAYRKAADIFGVTPAQMQAIVWVAIRGRAN